MADIEKNGSDGKSGKGRKIAVAVICALVLCAVVAVVIILLLRSCGEDDAGPVSSGGPAVSEPAAPEPEPEQQEKPEEPKVPAAVSDAYDEATLRELLLYDGDLTINLKGDVTIGAPLIVNGTKMLRGNKTIAYLRDGIADGYILSVSEGSSLITEGVTLDGRDRGNGISLGRGAELLYNSGTIANTSSAIIKAEEAVATVKDGRFYDGFCGILTSLSSKIYIEGGHFSDFYSKYVYIGAGGYLSVTGNPLFEDNDKGMINEAMICADTGSSDTVMEIHGGTYIGGKASDYDSNFSKMNKRVVFYTCGKLDVSYEGPDKNGYIEIYNIGADGVRWGLGADISLERVYMHDVNFGLDAGGTAIGCKIKVSDCRFEHMNFGLLLLQYDTDVTVENVTMKDLRFNGLDVHRSGITLRGKNVTIENAQRAGLMAISNDDADLEKSVVELTDFKLDGGTAGIQAHGGTKVTLKNGTVNNNRQYAADVLTGSVLKAESVQFNGNKSQWGGGAILIDTGGEIDLTDCEINNNTCELYGGAIGMRVAAGKIKLVRTEIIGNTVNNGAGGAISATANSDITTEDCVFENNRALGGDPGEGGAVLLNAGTKYRDYGSSFKNNYGTGNGGAVTGYSGATVEFHGTTFDGNHCVKFGGALRVNGITATGDNCTFINNYTEQGESGAISVQNGGSMTLTSTDPEKSVFRGNHAATSGGAASAQSGTLTVKGYSFEDNRALNGVGGAISTWGGTFNIDSCGFEGNDSTGNGGAVWLGGGATGNFNSCGFKENNSAGNGGAVWLGGGATGNFLSTAKEKPAFEGNETAGSGGAIYVDSAKLKVENYGFIENKANKTAGKRGGAIDIEKGVAGYTYTVSACDFTGNRVSNSGGAITLVTGASLTAESGCTFTENENENGEGGAVYVEKGCEYTDYGSVFDNNGAKFGGGALKLNIGAAATLYGTKFLNNHSEDCGGAVRMNNSTLIGFDCLFTGNHAARYGGALSKGGGNSSGGTLRLQYTADPKACLFKDNYTAMAGGAVDVQTVCNVSEITGYTFDGNRSDGVSSGNIRYGGGAVALRGGNLKLTDCEVKNSLSTRYGGAVLLLGGDAGAVSKFEAENTPFTGNYIKDDPADGSGGAIYAEGGASAVLSGGDRSKCVFESNRAATGGAVLLTGSATANISGYTFGGSEDKKNYTTVDSGGAIYVALGDLDLDGCTFSYNSSPKNGGAIAVSTPLDGNELTWQNCVFEKNHADGGAGVGKGGAVLIDRGTLNLTSTLADKSKFTGNYGRTDAAVSAGSAATVKVTGYTFDGNHSDGSDGVGGALATWGGRFEVSACVFGNNSAKTNGGAIWVGGSGSLSLGENAGGRITFTGNTAGGSGGALYVRETATVTGGLCDFGGESDALGNTAAGDGGAIYAEATVSLALNDSTFSHNGAKSGGAVFSKGAGTRQFTDCLFDTNKVTGESGEGGAVRIESGAVTLTGADPAKAVFKGNNANNGGAVSLAQGAAFTATEYSFDGNSAKTNGGALVSYGGTFNINSGSFKNNGAGSGGAVWLGGPGVMKLTGTESSKVTFTGNTADAYGGALYIRDTAAVTGEYCEFGGAGEGDGNTAGCSGGAVLVNHNATAGADLSFNNSSFTGNEAKGDKDGENPTGRGGAVYIFDYKGVPAAELAPVKFTGGNCSFTGNKAKTSGGALFVDNTAKNTSVEFTSTDGAKSKFEKNTAVQGGAVYAHSGINSGDGAVKITGYTFSGNTATAESNGAGAAMLIDAGSTVTTENCVFDGNFNDAKGAGAEGGAVLLSSGAYSDLGSTFSANHTKQSGGAIKANNGTTLNLTGTTFTGNYSEGNNGGAVRINRSVLNAKNCKFDGNTAYSTGGALSVGGGGDGSGTATVTLTSDDPAQSVFTRNSAQWGGAVNIQASYATLSVDGYTFGGDSEDDGNKAVINDSANDNAQGGAVLVDSGAGATFENCAFKNNTAVKYGGAVFTKVSAQFTDCLFDTNKVTGGANCEGGAVRVDTCTVTLTGTDPAKAVFKGNSADNGGAVSLVGSGATLNATGYTFDGNSAKTNGGAVATWGGNINIYGGGTFPSTLKNNSANTGGAVWIGGTGKITLTGTENGKVVFTGNHSDGNGTIIGGGALFVRDSAVVTGQYCVFGGENDVDGNYTNGFGGAVFINSDGASSFTNTEFKKNRADAESGGALAVDKANGNITLTDCTLSGNSAAKSGGAVYSKGDGTRQFTDCLFDTNKVTGESGEGGAVYVASGTVTLTGTDPAKAVFKGNSAYNGGAATVLGGGTFTANEYNFEGNHASYNGGAISSWDGKINLTGKSNPKSEFKGNYAGNQGGAIWVGGPDQDSNGKLTVRNYKFTDGSGQNNNNYPIGFKRGGYTVDADVSNEGWAVTQNGQ